MQSIGFQAESLQTQWNRLVSENTETKPVILFSRKSLSTRTAGSMVYWDTFKIIDYKIFFWFEFPDFKSENWFVLCANSKVRFSFSLEPTGLFHQHIRISVLNNFIVKTKHWKLHIRQNFGHKFCTQMLNKCKNTMSSRKTMFKRNRNSYFTDLWIETVSWKH